MTVAGILWPRFSFWAVMTIDRATIINQGADRYRCGADVFGG